MTTYQIIAPILCVLAIAYAWSLAVRGKKMIWEAILWTLFWSSIGYIALVPQSIGYISSLTGIQDQESAVIVTFMGILFFIVFHLIIRLEELEQRQTRLVRKIALRDADLADDSKKK